MALLITWADVKAIAVAIEDALDAVPVPKQTEIMTDAAIHVAVELLPFCAGFIAFAGQGAHDVYVRLMQQYWSAHIASQLDVLPAGEGAETTENIGSVSASRNQPVNNPQATEPHLETIYGRTFYYYLNKYEEVLKKLQRSKTIAFGVMVGDELQGLPRITGTC